MFVSSPDLFTLELILTGFSRLSLRLLKLSDGSTHFFAEFWIETVWYGLFRIITTINALQNFFVFDPVLMRHQRGKQERLLPFG